MSIYPTVGSTFQARYEIEALIGTGGFAQIFRAKQIDLGRTVAIKILSCNEFTERAQYDDDLERRFYREARIVSQLSDPNTVTMFDFGQSENGLLFMVMEFIDGVTIADAIDVDGPMSEDRAANILKRVARSLREAHEAGISHGDIKPSNIMLYEHLDEADHVKVLDFGIAHIMRSQSSERSNAGTPMYMSPERIMGKPQLPNSDIYSLGLVIYEMLTGQRAVDAESTISVISQHLSLRAFEFPDDLELGDELRGIVGRMIEKDPDDRYIDTKHLLMDLDDWFNSEADFERRKTNVYQRPAIAPTLDESSGPMEWLIQDRFRPVATISESGAGDVVRLEAIDTFLNRDVVLEVLPTRASADHARVKRFLHNARTFIGETQPGLPRVFDVIQSHDTVVVYEKISGETVRDRPLDPTSARRHIRGFIDAISRFHENKSWHGALSLDEILIDEDVLRIRSFGELFSVAKPSDRVLHANQNTDVFRVGILTWCMLTGTSDDTLPETLDRTGLDPLLAGVIVDATSAPETRPSLSELLDRF